MSANVYHGRADPAALMALIERTEPDLLSVQELNRSFLAKLRRPGIESRFPYGVVSVQPGVTGAGLFSRYPLRRLPSPPPPTSGCSGASSSCPGARRSG